jgi:hypothetical protein
MNRIKPADAYPKHSAFVHFEAVISPVVAFAAGRRYHFSDSTKFQELLERDLKRGIQVYWHEIFARAQWGALTALKRHLRWHAACCRLAENEPNYLGFAATLRALIESAADISHGLAQVAPTLAAQYGRLRDLLAGRDAPPTVCPELEDMLIHFLYARKVGKDETAPEAHNALTMKKYFETSQGSGPPLLQNLYAELCQIAHPAAYSTLAFADSDDGLTISMIDGGDAERIHDVCSRHHDAIEYAFFQGANAPLVVLKTLNLFPLKEFHSPPVDRISLDGVLAWRKVDDEIGRQNAVR